jgi:hypothetical protein
MDLLTIFKALGRLVKRAFVVAQERGLTNELVEDALSLVTDPSQATRPGNADKREWVVSILVSRGVPESLARLAVELAVQLWKQRQ